jgi:signal transduction histidine kinase
LPETSANHEVARIAQSDPEALLGKPYGQIIRCLYHLDDPRGCGFGPTCQVCSLRALGMRALKERKPERNVPAELTVVDRSGQRKHHDLLVSTSPFERFGEPAALFYVLDVSERRHYQQELERTNKELSRALDRLEQEHERTVQQERLAAVGRLAAGIGHEFNNLLTGIMGGADLIQIEDGVSDDVRGTAEMISETATRAAHLVQQIVDFSRRSMRRTQVFDLRPLIKEICKYLEQMLPEEIELRTQMGPARPPRWIARQLALQTLQRSRLAR